MFTFTWDCIEYGIFALLMLLFVVANMFTCIICMRRATCFSFCCMMNLWFSQVSADKKKHQTKDSDTQEGKNRNQCNNIQPGTLPKSTKVMPNTPRTTKATTMYKPVCALRLDAEISAYLRPLWEFHSEQSWRGFWRAQCRAQNAIRPANYWSKSIPSKTN